MVIPLHRADPQTLLTRPPLVTRGASSSVLPFDLHVLGLPPAFNLSHDQTLQLKVRFASTREAMLKENVVMNFNTCSLLRLDIFLRPETRDINPASAHTDCLINC